MKRISLLIVMSVMAIAILQTSCSIEKRHYRSGFYVDNRSHKTERATINTKAPSQPIALAESAKTQTDVTKENPQTIFHQNTETKLNQVEKPLVAQRKSAGKTTMQKTDDVKLAFKAEALKAFKENSNALAFYASKKAAKSGGGNQIVALVLCFFLGFLGVHSFYLGNTKKGVWQLVLFLVGILTSFFLIGFVFLAALSIWVLIDFIRIIIGDLGPGW